MEHFHNTIGESGDTLIKSEIKCKNQEERIVEILKEKNGIAVTPFYIHEAYLKLYDAVPITSIRRAITNLTNQNRLIKTSQMKTEQYGKPNNTWMYNQSFGK